jgi:hypothetical protein
MFRALNYQRTDGPGSIPQSYVAALSHAIGLLFRACLCGSLAIAYTQYLWRLMRKETIEVSSIELLHKITHNPFLLGFPEVVRTTPTLFVLALLTWFLPLAITFPPGALIVVSTPAVSNYSGVVPTYNASQWANMNITIAVSVMGGGISGYR